MPTLLTPYSIFVVYTQRYGSDRVSLKEETLQPIFDEFCQRLIQREH